MRPLSTALFVSLSAIAVAIGPGCSGGAIELPHGTGAGDPGTRAIVKFDEPMTLTLTPAEARAIRVIVSPPGDHRLRFTLIGDSLDGWLDRDDVAVSGEDASVVMHAPTQPAVFRLRASVLDAEGEAESSAEIAISVSEQGFGAVRVIPQYQGERAVETWVASALTHASCSDIAGLLPGDLNGALVSESADAPLIDGIPVGPILAIALRSGHFAWGCADVTHSSPNETIDVPVLVLDKPLELGPEGLSLSLTYDDAEPSYQDILGSSATALADGFLPEGASMAAALLNGMQALVPASDLTAFQNARIEGSWDVIADQHLDSLGVDPRGIVLDWAWLGLAQAPASVAIDLSGNSSQGQVLIMATRIAGVDAAAAGVTTEGGFAWATAKSDHVSFGGTMLFEPSRVAGVLAIEGALGTVQQATSVPDAIAFELDCEGLAAALGPFGSCDAACSAILCRAAIEARWEGALGASLATGALGELTINAACSAAVDDEAIVMSIDGDWLGTFDVGASNAQVVGTVSGVAPAPPTP